MSRPLLYIHGFASSAHSHKVGVLRRHFDEVYCPSLSHIPTLAIETLSEFIHALAEPPMLIGSSLGGYYALYLSQHHDLPAILINPVVGMQAPLAQVVGMNHHYYDGSRFEFTEEHLKSLARYACPQPDEEKLMVMVEMGDELINHRRTLAALPDAQHEVTKGGNHAYSGFEGKMSTIRKFIEGFEISY
jgi:predicted esterase YcpF (UPF0227 family)